MSYQKRFFDEKFRGNKLRYILQCCLTTICIFVVLLVLDVFSSAAIIAALGASTFIAFAMPHRNVSKPRYLIGGYIVGTIAGILCHGLANLNLFENLPLVNNFSYIMFGAIAVGLSMFLMAITDTEHPPAASLALGLVLNQCTLAIVSVVITGILMLVLIKTLLKPFLKRSALISTGISTGIIFTDRYRFK